MAKNKNKNTNNNSGLGTLHNPKARSVELPSGDMTGNNIASNLGAFSKKLGLLNAIKKDNAQHYNGTIYKLQSLSSLTRKQTNKIITELDDQLVEANNGITDLIGGLNNIRNCKDSEFGKKMNHFEMSLDALVTTQEKMNSTFFGNLDMLLYNRLINIESGIYAIAAAFWGWDKVKQNKSIDTNLKVGSDAFFSNFSELNKKQLDYIKDMERASSSGSDNESKPSGTTLPMIDPTNTIWSTQTQIMNFSELGGDNGIIKNAIDNSVVLDSINEYLKTIATKGITTTGLQGSISGANASGATDNMSGVVIDNKKASEDAINNTIELLAKLKEVANSKDSQSLIVSNEKVEKLKEVVGVYADLIRDLHDSLKALSGPIANSNKQLRDSNSSPIDLIHKLIDGFSTLDTKKLNVKKIKRTIKKIRPLFTPDGPLAGIITDIANFETEDNKKVAQISSAIINILQIPQQFSDEHIDEVREGIKNGIKVIGDKNHLKRTFFGLNVKLKDLVGDINSMAKELGSVKNSKSVDTIKSIFSLYSNMSDVLDEIDIDDITDGIDAIIDKEHGLNAKIGKLVESLMDTYVNAGLSADDLKEIDTTFTSLNVVMGRYKDLDSILKFKVIFKLFIKLEALKDINNSLVHTMQRMQVVMRKAKTLDGFIEATDKITGAVDALRELGRSISVKDTLNLSMKMNGISGTLKDVKSMYQQFEKAFEKIKEDDLKAMVAKNGKLENLGKLVKTLSDITGGFEKLTIGAKIGAGGIKSTVDIIKSVKEIVDILGEKEFGEKLKYIVDAKTGIAHQIWLLSKILLKVSLYGGLLIAPSVIGSIGFKLIQMMVKQIGRIVDILSDFDSDKIKTVKENIDSIEKITKGLLKICAYGSYLSALAIPAMLGFKLTLFAFRKGLKKLIMQVVGFFKNEKDYKKTEETVSQLAHIVKSFAIIMTCGALCGVLAIPAMLGFVTMIPALITLKLVLKVIGSISGGKEGEKNKTDAKSIAKLIMYLGGIMLIGGVIGGIVGKMMPNIMMFTMALSMFIFMVVGALTLATSLGGGIKQLEKNAKGIMQIVIVSSLILLFGGAIMLMQPKMIIASLAWGIILGAFIFGLVFTIKFGAKAMKDCQSSLTYIMAFLIVTSTVLLLPAAILMQNPKMSAYLVAWVAIFTGFMFAMRRAMSTVPGKRKIMKCASNIWAIAGLAMALAASTWIIVDASNRVKDWKQLAITVGIMFGVLTAITSGAILLSKIKKQIIDGTIALGLVETLCIGLGITMMLLSLAVNTIKDTTTFNARVWSMIGIISAIGVLASTAGSIAPMLNIGIAAIGGIEILVMGLGACMIILAKAMDAIAEVSKKEVNMKGLIGLIDSIYGLVWRMAPLAHPLVGITIASASAAVATLGMAISKIAEGVAEASNMHYTKYENGKAVGEFNLTSEDFNKAALNTKQIVTTLGSAILDIYDENPEIFNTGTLLGDLIGTKTKFEKVVRSVSTLGKAISLIAKGVKTAANMNYTKYENGKAVGEFNLDKSDYEKAANNTKLVVKTLGRAIMQAYDENPEIFTFGGSGNGLIASTLGAIGDFFGMETKFGRVVKAVGTLGNLISNIAGGVSNMANMVITSYDEKGNEHKRNANMADFALAAANTNFIVTFLGKTIMDVYDSHPDLFSSGSEFGDMIGFNPKFKNIVDTISALGTMMSNIAGGIQAFANNQVPVYGVGGKILTYKKIEPSDYSKAAETITELVTTMGDAIMNVYDMHPDWFKGNWWRFGSTSDNNKFTDVVKSLTGMSNLISAYAKAIQDYASGNITLYGPDGKILSKIPINESTYRSAAKAVSSCITTLSNAVYQTWNAHKDDIFDEDNFEPLMDNLERMSKLISKYSDAVKDFSNLYYNVYDDNGKLIGKKRVTSEDFKNAADTVSTMITTLATGVKNAYDKNPKLFTDTNADINKKSSGKTWFEQIINSFLSVGPLISSMSDAVLHYATLRVPIYGTDGKPTGGTRALTKADFTNAGDNINEIMTKMVTSVWNIYQNENHRQMFQDASNWNGNKKDNSNPFYVMSSALNQTGIMIQNSAKATQDVLNIKGFENPKNISRILDSRIAIMTTALVHAVNNAYSKAPDLFDDALSNDSVFLKVQTAMESAYELVMQGIQVYKEAQKLDIDAIKKLTGDDSTDVKANVIYKMIDGLAAPIVSVYSGTVQLSDKTQFPLRQLFDEVGTQKNMFVKITEAIKSVATIMGTVGNAYEDINNLKINSVDDISKKISQMLLGLVTPIGIAYNTNKGAFDDVLSVSTLLSDVSDTIINTITFGLLKDNKKQADTPAQRVVQAIGAVCGVMSVVIKAYESVANMKIPSVTFVSQRMQTLIVTLAHTLCNVGNNEYVKSLNDVGTTLDSNFRNINKVMFGWDGQHGIIGIYNSFLKMRVGSQAEAKVIAGKLEILITAIPKIFSEIANNKTIMSGLESANDISDYIEDCHDAIITITNIYNKVIGSINNFAKRSGKPADEATKYIGTSIATMFTKLGEALRTDNLGVLCAVDTMKELEESSKSFNNSMTNFVSVYNKIPTLNKDIDYFIPYMVKLQNELGNVPKLEEFKTEVNNLINFNNSVNSLQARNVEVLTKLFIEFNKFASKFGNLDQFTKVLATKMAQCLTFLAEQIRDNAKVINKAEAIQKKRQEEIKKTIEEFKTLANMGLEVTVKSAETESTIGSVGTGGFSGDTNETTNQNTVEGQSIGHGSTALQENYLGDISTNVRQIWNKMKSGNYK